MQTRSKGDRTGVLIQLDTHRVAIAILLVVESRCFWQVIIFLAKIIMLLSFVNYILTYFYKFLIIL